MNKKITTEPKSVFREYTQGSNFKAGIGAKGIFEQSKINERFYVGDQWYGARCGNDRPLVRRNIIKRIADYKLSSISAAPIAVNYSAEGVASNTVSDEDYKTQYNAVVNGESDFSGETSELEISVIMELLTSYGNSTIERLRFQTLSSEALKNAYISGTGVLYTYWNELIDTGLYAEAAKIQAIKGDIACEVLDIENVVFGDPNSEDVQSQPYIIISQRRDYEDVRREAKRNRIAAEVIESIKPDGVGNLYTSAGTRGEEEPTESRRVTVYTKFYKEWDDEGKTFKVMCFKCTENATVRRPFNMGISLYPISVVRWDSRRSCAYGDSEITYLIPNQIAINRALSSQVWNLMLKGMPIMLVNGDIVTENITNDPGQIIKVYGGAEELASAVRYIDPPGFVGQMITSVNDLAANTLSDSGANDAALGNVRPDNAAAIIQMREAALQPMQLKQNVYYAFIEDTMRIWAEFWLKLYGDRKLKVDTINGVAYVPFHSSRYEKLIISARVDVGASTLWSQSVVVSTLDALLSAQIITPEQYLERMPENIIPNKTGLINEIKEANAQGTVTPPADDNTTNADVPPDEMPEEVETTLSDEDILAEFARKKPEMYEQFMKLPKEEQAQMLMNIRG